MGSRRGGGGGARVGGNRPSGLTIERSSVQFVPRLVAVPIYF